MTEAKKVNILLVDDQPAKLLSYEVILEQLGENLIKVDSAKAALEQLLKSDFAVVLLDVCMPEMDGFELAKMIRNHPRCRKTSIILVSAVYMSDFDRLRGYDSGAVDYVPVPIVPEVLRAKVAIFSDLYRKTEQLQSLNSELEARVTQRTIELEAALAERVQVLESERQARAAAEAANRLKDDFLATLSHELRTPINSVLGWVYLMRRHMNDSTMIAEGMDVIERGVRTQVQLIDDLLDVNRITTGKLSIRHEAVDLATTLQAAVDTVAQAAADKGIAIRTLLAGAPVTLFGDATRLQQVFWNLLSNAVKFTPAGGEVVISVELDDSQVRIYVTDTGQGIKPEFLSSVFERFRQADSSVSRAHGGLGLGLSIVQHLVELHGGSICAKSAGEGRGACFTVTLPFRDEKPDMQSARQDRDGQVELFGLRVLIVDDDQDTREVVARTLGEFGAQTRTAENTDRALAVIREWQPDILVSDIGMPGMDGYAFIREVRSLPAGAATPAVALTAYTRDVERDRALQAGYDRHIAKPLNPTELLAAIVQLTGRGSAAAAEGAGNTTEAAAG